MPFLGSPRRENARNREILGITTRTVVFHLENARSKLSASTVTQAVAEAAQRGLILS
jgi:LuxR family transcriptional activator of conjugal transfer of Ti plasmids